MQSAPVRAVFDVITDFLASDPTPEEIIAYHLPEDLQQRADYLLDQNGEDLLTFEEREEMREFMNADEMIALLKAKLTLKLRDQPE
jgi:UDP-N-acetyl-D-mannosaminuronic acid transferase (WecB/TagA/CpsF family)